MVVMEASLLDLIQLLVERVPGIVLGVVIAFQRQLCNRPELVRLGGRLTTFNNAFAVDFCGTVDFVNVIWQP
jgi:hypothetical protein